MPLRGVRRVPAREARAKACDAITLDAQDRHLRRKLIVTAGGIEVIADLPLTAYFEHGDHIELDDGRTVEIRAAEEELYEVRGAHLATLAWHIGNRHLPAQIEIGRILIKRDPVIRGMLINLGAAVNDVRERFEPVHGAYHSHGP